MSKKKFLVSIIINCFNGEKYLKDCLESVRLQTYENWEIIFWDNKSKDNSKKIFKSFKDKRFKYFLAKKHTNLYEAKNLALKKANGDIIAFLDTDDLWLKNKIQKQVNYLSQNPSINFVYSNLFKTKKFLLFDIKKKIFNKKLPEGYICNKLLNHYVVGWPTVVVRKKVILKKKTFNEKIDMLADYDFVMRYSYKNKIGVIQEPLAIYREHPDQVSRAKFFTQANQYVRWFLNEKKNKKLTQFKNFNKLEEKYEFYKVILQLDKSKNVFEKCKIVSNISHIKNFFKSLFFILLKSLYVKYLLSTA